MLAPLTDLVGECVQTKITKQKGTKKKAFYWSPHHQAEFDSIKKAIAHDVILAYPDLKKSFEIYTDVSSKQFGAVIIQDSRPIVFSGGET